MHEREVVRLLEVLHQELPVRGRFVDAPATEPQRVELRTHPLWKAAFGSQLGSIHGWPVVTMWQFSANVIDRDKFFGDAVTWGKLSVPEAAVA